MSMTQLSDSAGSESRDFRVAESPWTTTIHGSAAYKVLRICSEESINHVHNQQRSKSVI